MVLIVVLCFQDLQFRQNPSGFKNPYIDFTLMMVGGSGNRAPGDEMYFFTSVS